MQQNESVMDVDANWKFRHSGSLMMPNSYPRDGIFNQHLTTIKDSYNWLLYERTSLVRFCYASSTIIKELKFNFLRSSGDEASRRS